MSTIARMVAYLEANTVNFDQGFGKATQTVGRFNAVSVDAARGSAMVDKAFTNLAFASVGLEGKVGKLAEGLLMFGGGSGMVVAAAAGIGAIGLAMKKMGDEAEKATKRVDDLIKTSRSGKAGAAAAEAPLQKRLAEIEAQLRETRPLGPGLTNPMTWMMPIPVVRGAARDALLDEQARIRGALNSATPSPIKNLMAGIQFTQGALMNSGSQNYWMQNGITMMRAMSVFSDPALSHTSALPAPGGPLTLDLARNKAFQRERMDAAFGNFHIKEWNTANRSSLFKFHGITGQNAAIAGIDALGAAINGGGVGALLSGGLSLGGSAFGPVGQALGGLVGSAIGGLFGGGENPVVTELKRANALLQRQLDAQARQHRATITLITSSDTVRNPAAIDRAAREFEDATDRGLIRIER